MSLLRRQHPQEEMRCSFCRKSQEIVGKLVSNPIDYPRAYICDECIAVCSRVVEGKEHPLLDNPVVWEFLNAAEQWTARESKGQDATEQLSEMRRLAAFIFVDSSRD